MYTVTGNDAREFEPAGFRWMPAAIEYNNMGGLGAYVRYKRYNDKPVGLRLREPNRIILECPDRDLCLVRDNHHQWGYRPAPGVWDEYVNFGLFNAQTPVDTDLQFWMINYTEYINSKDSPRLRLNRERQPYESYVVADSGGFQLAMGRYEWLDPHQIVKWYNENVDLGMALDIPTYGVESDEDFLTLARAHRHNLDLMMKEKRPSLELINIFHGHSHERMNAYRKVVEREDVTRLALGGSYLGTIFSTLDNNFGLMYRLRDQYKHFHILGVWNLLQLVSLMRYAGHGLAELVTSDSSTPIQNANAKRYAYQPAIDAKWEMRDLGFIGSTTQVNHNVTLPCHCPVCSTIKYADVFGVLGGALITHILAHHNVYQMNNYVKSMSSLVKELTIKELTELLVAQLGSRRGVEEAKLGLQLADAIAEDGYDVARKKFSAYLGNMNSSVEYTEETNLFDDVEAPSNEEEATAPPSLFERKVALAKRFLSATDADAKLHGKKIESKEIPNKVVLKATAKIRKSGIEREKKKVVAKKSTKRSPSVRGKQNAVSTAKEARTNTT